jgi:hypothetical protein
MALGISSTEVQKQLNPQLFEPVANCSAGSNLSYHPHEKTGRFWKKSIVV